MRCTAAQEPMQRHSNRTIMDLKVLTNLFDILACNYSGRLNSILGLISGLGSPPVMVLLVECSIAQVL